MSVPRVQRIMTVCGVALLVLGIPGATVAHDDLQRDSQFLAIGMGVMGLLFARVFLPWAQRRGAARKET